SVPARGAVTPVTVPSLLVRVPQSPRRALDALDRPGGWWHRTRAQAPPSGGPRGRAVAVGCRQHVRSQSLERVPGPRTVIQGCGRPHCPPTAGRGPGTGGVGDVHMHDIAAHRGRTDPRIHTHTPTRWSTHAHPPTALRV